jgi:hypothetical protein
MSAKARNPYGALLNALGTIVSDINAHQDAIFDKKDPTVQKEIVVRLKNLEAMVNWFSHFNEDFMKTLGITRKDIVKGMTERKKGSEEDKVLLQAEKVKKDLLLSYAGFLKKAAEHSKGSKESLLKSKTPQTDKKTKKKSAKATGGYKKMVEGQKWKKM